MYCYTFAFDLHVLSTPPAFTLSQDQTLQLNLDRLHLVFYNLAYLAVLSLTHLRVNIKKLIECPHSSLHCPFFKELRCHGDTVPLERGKLASTIIGMKRGVSRIIFEVNYHS